MHYCSSFGQQGSFNEYKLQGSFRQQATNYRALLRDCRVQLLLGSVVDYKETIRSVDYWALFTDY